MAALDAPPSLAEELELGTDAELNLKKAYNAIAKLPCAVLDTPVHSKGGPLGKVRVEHLPLRPVDHAHVRASNTMSVKHIVDVITDHADPIDFDLALCRDLDRVVRLLSLRGLA